MNPLIMKYNTFLKVVKCLLQNKVSVQEWILVFTMLIISVSITKLQFPCCMHASLKPLYVPPNPMSICHLPKPQVLNKDI